jgi:hypothetical protein
MLKILIVKNCARALWSGKLPKFFFITYSYEIVLWVKHRVSPQAWVIELALATPWPRPW